MTKYKLKRTLKDLSRKTLHGFLCFLIVVNQIAPTYAQNITVDAGANAANQADLTTAPNGAPVINIVTPNGAGVSHNKFTDYNVTNQGLILNNSRGVGASQLGGAMIGNPNVAGGEASLIINEVTSGNSSALEGATEVFGRAADVIVANPNGITCDGCGFINTPKATLTTGTPQFDGAGALSNISVNDGTITIQGTGLEVTGNNKAEILSRAIEINGDIHAGEINLVTGRNDVSNAGIVSPKADDGSTKPALAIDSSALGGMYAGAITLTGTESGVGFKLDGDMAASTGDLIITNDGKIEMKNASAVRDVKVTTSGVNDIDLTGKVTSQGETVLDSGNDINLNATATIESSGANTQVKAANKIDNQKGAIIGYQDVTINADELENNEGLIMAGNDLSIEGVAPTTAATLIENTGGSIESFGGDVSIRATTLNNIGSAEIETVSKEYYFRFRQSTVPGYLPHNVDLSPEGYAQFYDGNNTYAVAANPLLIEQTMTDLGVNIEDYYNPVTDRYVFEVADWLTLGPNSYADWRAIIDLRSDPNRTYTPRTIPWALFTPDEEHNAPSNGYLIAALRTDQLVGGTNKPASILSQSGNIDIIADTINNNNSFISAAQDINLTGTTLTNAGTTLFRRVTEGTSYNNQALSFRETGWGNWLQNRRDIQTVFSDVIGEVPAGITAGGTVTGDFIGDVTIASIPGTAISDIHVNDVGASVIRDGFVNGNREAAFFDNSALTIPSTDTNFLYETRFDFTNLGTFFGSDYFLNGVLGGFDPDSISKRLGDAYIDSRYITEQVIAQSGRKYLDTAFASDTDQVKALLDRGIAANSALNLSPLMALTVDQQNALTQDIVWYEERVINGETVIVPQLYLASATLDAQGQKLRGGIISGRNVNLTAENVNLNMGRITALEDVNVNANDSIVSQSGVIDANNLNLNAGNDIVNTTKVTLLGNGTTDIGANTSLRGTFEATNDVNLTAGELVGVIGADVTAGNDINIDAKNVLIGAQALQWGIEADVRDGVVADTIGGVNGLNMVARNLNNGFAKKGTYTANKVVQDGATLTSGNNVNINTLENIRVSGSEIEAQNDINLSAIGSVLIDTAEETVYEHTKTDTRDHAKLTRTHQASKLTTQDGDINIKSTLGNVTLKAAELDSGNDINLEATTGKVALLTEKDYDFEDNTSTKSNAVWQSYENKGHEIETIRHTILTGEGELNIIAANGVEVEYEHTGNLDADIAQLSQASGLEWMAELKDDPNVDFIAVEAIYKEWHEESEGLSGPAAAVIAIAVSLITQQYQLGAALLAQGGVVVTGAAATAANAAVGALLSQTVVSTINNKGDLGAVFGELATSDTIRNLAAAALTAGLTDKLGGSELLFRSEIAMAPEFFNHVQEVLIGAGVQTGVDVVISGADFSESLKGSLQSAAVTVFGTTFSKKIGRLVDDGQINLAQQLIAHGLVGCITATAMDGNCGSAATGAALGEAVAELSHQGLGLSKTESAKLGRYASLISSLATADTALDVTATNIATANAINNNFLLPKEKLALSELLKDCGINPICKSAVEKQFKTVSKVRDKDFIVASDACSKNASNCDNFYKIHYDLRQELTDEGNEYYLSLTKEQREMEFSQLPDIKSIYHTYVTDNNGRVINEKTQQLVGYKKLIHPIIGYEIVLDAQNNIVTDTLNAGTYNFYNTKTSGVKNPLLVGDKLHKIFDVEPYFKHGNSKVDPSTEQQRNDRWQVVVWEKFN